METLLIFVVAGIGFYLYQQNQAKNAPIKKIELNELIAFNNKETLLEYLEEDIEERVKSLKSKHPRPNDEPMIRERNDLINKGIPKLEVRYKQLKERFKFDTNELLKLSIDYNDWFYNHKKYYDPHNYSLWNDSSWDDQEEAVIKIREIERRLKIETK
jgi:hypothetical protein